MVCYKRNLFLCHVCVPVMLFSAWSCLLCYTSVCVFIHVDPLSFPDQLSSYGLTIELLSQAFDSAQSGSREELSTCWSLHGLP